MFIQRYIQQFRPRRSSSTAADNRAGVEFGWDAAEEHRRSAFARWSKWIVETGIIDQVWLGGRTGRAGSAL
jgi:hypothetical protein